MRKEWLFRCLAAVLALIVCAVPIFALRHGRRLPPADPIQTQLNTLQPDTPDAPEPDAWTESERQEELPQEDAEAPTVQPSTVLQANAPTPDTRDASPISQPSVSPAVRGGQARRDYAFSASSGIVSSGVAAGSPQNSPSPAVPQAGQVAVQPQPVPIAGSPSAAASSGKPAAPETPQPSEPQTQETPHSETDVELYTNFDHLRDGDVLEDAVKLLRVSAYVLPGRQTLYADSINVTLNGAVIPSRGTDVNGFSEYDLHFAADNDSEYGDYTLQVVARHGSDSVSKRWALQYHAVPDGTPGKVQVYLDASVLGLGVLDWDRSFAFARGETAMDVMLRFLEENGYTVTRKEDGTYISAVSRPDMCLGFSGVPQAMREYLAAATIPLYEDQFDPDSLAEQKITPKSGWIYTVNGAAPGRGLNDYILSDGDVLTLRFTLAEGSDADFVLPDDGTE